MMQPMPSNAISEASDLAQCDDDTLLDRMKGDDTQAYRILVERHIDRAYALALRILHNMADAEDISQEALLKAWIHRHSWQSGKAKFSTWLYRVVFNRCVDLRRLPTTSWIEDVPEPADERPDAVHDIHRRQIFDRLGEAMATLPEQQRAALTLSYYDDLGNSEIAEIMGTTVQAVESLLKRGRQGLRDRLRRSEREIRQSFVQS